VDFLPFRDDAGLLFVVGRITPGSVLAATGPVALPEAALALREAALRRYGLETLESDLPAMLRVAQQARLAGSVRVPVLIVGERGTGKEWLARAIHALGPPRGRPFVAIDCARLREAAAAGALFRRGELAQPVEAGTLYMRQPSSLPRELQQLLCLRLF